MSFACRVKKSTPITVACSAVTGSDSGFSGSGTVVNDSEPSPVIEGGSGSYSYLYEHVSTSQGGTPNCPTPTNEQGGWTRAGVADGTPSISSWRLTVEDLNSGEEATTTFSVTLTWINLS